VPRFEISAPCIYLLPVSDQLGNASSAEISRPNDFPPQAIAYRNNELNRHSLAFSDSDALRANKQNLTMTAVAIILAGSSQSFALVFSRG
jgi:hypothetical protein